MKMPRESYVVIEFELIALFSSGHKQSVVVEQVRARVQEVSCAHLYKLTHLVGERN